MRVFRPVLVQNSRQEELIRDLLISQRCLQCCFPFLGPDSCGGYLPQPRSQAVFPVLSNQYASYLAKGCVRHPFAQPSVPIYVYLHPQIAHTHMVLCQKNSLFWSTILPRSALLHQPHVLNVTLRPRFGSRTLSRGIRPMPTC